LSTLVEIVKGKYATVLATKKVEKDLKKIGRGDRRSIKRLQNHMEHYAKHGPDLLDGDDQFKYEDRVNMGLGDGQTVKVYVFKGPNHLRVYGCLDNDGRVSLCGSTRVKQKNKAIQGDLEKAAKEFGKYVSGELS